MGSTPTPGTNVFSYLEESWPPESNIGVNLGVHIATYSEAFFIDRFSSLNEVYLEELSVVGEEPEDLPSVMSTGTGLDSHPWRHYFQTVW